MSNAVSSPHDRFFRRSLSDPRVAKEFFESHLPPAILNIVDLNRLTLCKESHIDDHLKVGIIDMLFQTYFKNRPGFIYLLNEHTTVPQKLMPLRLLKYTLPILEEKSKESPQGLLPIVYPMVFYTGTGAYTYSTDIFDLFENPDLARDIFAKPFHLVEVNKISDEVLKQKVWSGIMGLSMKHIFERDIFPYLPDMLSLLREIEDTDKNYVIAVVTYLLNTNVDANKTKRAQTVKTIQQGLYKTSGDEIMTIAEMYQEEGRQEGIKEGQLTAKKQIAQKMLQQGFSMEVVRNMVDLPFDEIRN